MRFNIRQAALLGTLAVAFSCAPATFGSGPQGARIPRLKSEISKLRSAIDDLVATFGARYPGGAEYRRRLDELERQAGDKAANVSNRLDSLKHEALLANPLLQDRQLLLVRRRPKDLQREGVFTEHDEQIGYSAGPGREIGMPSNHECNASLERSGYDNELAILAPIRPDGQLRTLYRPEDGGYVGEADLHWDGTRLLFTKSDATNWKVFEISADGSGLRQVSQMPDDVDCMDPCYLPSGKIVFGSTAAYQSVPCWHGQKRVSNLYVMDSDGAHARQLCYDQDHNFHPCVLPSGEVLYHRWDYTGISHIFLRPLMVMRPDGTGQRAVYGSNSWYPNSLYFPRPMPGHPGQLVAILSGYHGVHRMGQLVVLDLERGWHEATGLVRRISGTGAVIEPRIEDALVNRDWPKFLHPYPLSDKYFLVSCWTGPRADWSIYLADIFDNLVPVYRQPGYALLEPTLLAACAQPPVLPERVDLEREDATVYIHDVYRGQGLAGVPRGTIKSLRVVGYDFGYRGLAGSDKIGLGGPWDAMRMVGTIPLNDDGSAHFRVPANTPLAVQALDAQGQAVQLMRSWFTAMPGEKVACLGCHETPAESASGRLSLAALGQPRELDPWYGPPRGFDFAREVQPVLDRYCVVCHDGSNPLMPDLRAEDRVENPVTVAIGYAQRLDPAMLRKTGGKLAYTPAYQALISRIRRPGIEDDVSLLNPGEYHADTSPLIQMLGKGHNGVRLDRESWDRLITWIDLNGPCHGTWGDVFPIPDRAHARRMELRKQFGGASVDPEQYPVQPATHSEPVMPHWMTGPTPVTLEGWPLTTEVAREQQQRLGVTEREISLGDGLTMKLVRIPAGSLVLGDADGAPDEQPQTVITIDQPFWMGACEVTNEQYHVFAPGHESGYYVKRHARADDRGLPLNEPHQPVVRVSWHEADAFCKWLTERTGLSCSLPTEAQWEYACRAGTATPLYFGYETGDYSHWANLADRSFSHGLMKLTGPFYPAGVTQATGGVPHLLLEGARLADTDYCDHAVVTVAVGGYQPNAWGLRDMHGNAAEWTGSDYLDYHSGAATRLADENSGHPKSVRGGSFFDPPTGCRSSGRLGYPTWQRVFNVGFRVIVRDQSAQ